MSNVSEFGFGKGDNKFTNKSSRFKGEKDKRYRLSFAWWDGIEEGTPNFDAETPKFIGGKRIYIPGVGYVFDKGPEFARFSKDGARTAIATAVIVWPTMSNGKLDADLFKRDGGQVMSWVFGVDKYRQIEPNHVQHPFGGNDLIITCTDSQYQKMSFVSAPDNLFRELVSGKFAEKMGSRGQDLMSEVQGLVGGMMGEIARDLTLDQIREKLGGVSSSPVEDSGNVGDVDDMLAGLLD